MLTANTLAARQKSRLGAQLLAPRVEALLNSVEDLTRRAGLPCAQVFLPRLLAADDELRLLATVTPRPGRPS
jgi:hypothetical protein